MNACRVLFVTNGHGEVAIAACIASRMPAGIACDHLALVGSFQYPSTMREVGPRRAMPSGGLIAMGNISNIIRDLRAGLLTHTLAQLRFLAAVRGTYDVVIGVGDIFALIMALRAGARATMYTGTAKSVYVAPYGPYERRVLARAQAVFVRDAPTAQDLRSHGIAARPANVIVDLHQCRTEAALAMPLPAQIAMFPGSRENAYGDAVTLARAVREVVAARTGVGAMLSIAPALDVERMARVLESDGWEISRCADAGIPFSLRTGGREAVRAWTGSLGAMIANATIVLGQAGTANEAAAAAGVPVIAYEKTRPHWYRKRQMALLDGALRVVSGSTHALARAVLELLADDRQRERMGAVGRERMGPAGGATIIAQEIVRRCG
jgi:uncharacterized protein (TIGR03492 family)